MKLLIAASDRMEFSGITHTAPAAAGFGSSGWRRTARLGGHDLLLVANGAGARNAAAAVEAAIHAFRPDAVASTGYCGALAEELCVADIVVGSEVIGPTGRYAAGTITSQLPFRSGVILTHDRVVQTVGERRILSARGAAVVEMEAAGVAERALAHGLPFYCVKAVTDLANETLANDYNRALREDGHFDTIVLLTGTLRNPFRRIPELLRLQKRCARASRALGAFFADCRF